MAITRRAQLRKWFGAGQYPTAEQFSDLIDSLFHKTEDTLPVTSVEGLDSYLNGKYDKAMGEQMEEAQDALATTLDNYKVEAREVRTSIAKLEDATGGGYTFIERYDRLNFGAALRKALADAPIGAILDCTYFKGPQTVTEGFRITKPVKIIFGSIDLTFDNTTGSNLFTIASDNVVIEGVNRNTDKTSVASSTATVFRMVNPDPELEGYHFKSCGHKNIAVSGLTLIGVQSTLGRQYGNQNYPIDGVGGLYFEKADPGTTTGGNTVNALRLQNLLIDKTKAHALYIDTPILSLLKDIRISDAAGHGVFINGGTTTLLESVYVASCRLAGFCLYGHTYGTLLNCVAEHCGCGFWIRSSFNVSAFTPGVENTNTYGANPWKLSQPISKKYGFCLITSAADGTTVPIPDVTSENAGYFIGHAFVVSGGKNINIYGPYAMNLAAPMVYEVYPGGTEKSKNVRYLLVAGNNRGSTVQGLGCKDGVGTAAVQQYEVEIAAEVKNIDLSYNVDDTTLGSSLTPVVDTKDQGNAPIFCATDTAYIHIGRRVLSQVKFTGGILVGEYMLKEAVGGLQINTPSGKVVKVLDNGSVLEDVTANP